MSDINNVPGTDKREEGTANDPGTVDDQKSQEGTDELGSKKNEGNADVSE
jgi:hypothetical protein